jgi:hypothetical protein
LQIARKPIAVNGVEYEKIQIASHPAIEVEQFGFCEREERLARGEG